MAVGRNHLEASIIVPYRLPSNSRNGASTKQRSIRTMNRPRDNVLRSSGSTGGSADDVMMHITVCVI